MATSKLIESLSSQVPVVNSDGTPTAQFMRVLQKLGIGSGLSKDAAGNITFASIAAKTIMANKTGATASPTACTISDILDFLTTTRGSILFRGASGWQALAPGTATNVLQTNGAGADPTWVPAAAGGGASYEGFGNLLSLAGLTKVGANLTLTDGTKAHQYLWTASGVNQLQYAYRAAPVTPWDLYIRFSVFQAMGANVDFGIILRNSTTGKLTLSGVFGSGSTKGILAQEWTNATTFSATIGTNIANIDDYFPTWLRVNNDGTTLKFYYSSNGIDWVLSNTRTLAAFMGSVDGVGVGGVPQSANNAWVSNFGHTVPA